MYKKITDEFAREIKLGQHIFDLRREFLKYDDSDSEIRIYEKIDVLRNDFVSHYEYHEHQKQKWESITLYLFDINSEVLRKKLNDILMRHALSEIITDQQVPIYLSNNGIHLLSISWKDGRIKKIDFARRMTPLD
jgi:hypothetical protein